MSILTRQEAEQFRKLARAIDAQRLREAIQAAAATGRGPVTVPGVELDTGPRAADDTGPRAAGEYADQPVLRSAT